MQVPHQPISYRVITKYPKSKSGPDYRVGLKPCDHFVSSFECQTLTFWNFWYKRRISKGFKWFLTLVWSLNLWFLSPAKFCRFNCSELGYKVLTCWVILRETKQSKKEVWTCLKFFKRVYAFLCHISPKLTPTGGSPQLGTQLKITRTEIDPARNAVNGHATLQFLSVLRL